MTHFTGKTAAVRLLWLCSLASLSTGCRSALPGIQFTEVPVAAVGGASRMERIAGRVMGARRGQRIVLYAKSGPWWVQPTAAHPFTAITSESSWENTTHLGMEYAALLVDAAYNPPKISEVLPARGGSVIAVATVRGRPSPQDAPPAPKTIRFSGYDWTVVQEPTDSGGVMKGNRASNVWTDDRGRLHLRIARSGAEWTCAEVSLSRSLGYGVYRFVVAPLPVLEPATVVGLFTWDAAEAGQNHREIDIELSQWGDGGSKNGQFVIQPYYVPANVYRFQASRARTTYSFDWQPGRVAFQASGTKGAKHIFTSGVPSPGDERVRMNFYVFGKTRTPQKRGAEVVIEKFEYLP